MPVKKMIAAGLLVPPLVYPCLTGLLWALDTSVGDQSVSYLCHYESHRYLVIQTLRDWGQALPSLYGLVIPLWLLSVFGLGGLGLQAAWLLAVVGAVSGASLAWYLTGTPVLSATMTLAMTGTLTGWLLATIVPIGAIQQAP